MSGPAGWPTAPPPDTNPKPRASFGRIIITPIILMVAGYLVAGVVPGVAIAAILGIAYILYATSR